MIWLDYMENFHVEISFHSQIIAKQMVPTLNQTITFSIICELDTAIRIEHRYTITVTNGQ